VEDVFRAIVLGIVQGLTEFLPISSSGHLILVRELFGWEFEDDLTFDVAIHIGTLVAVLAYFWNEWVLMARGGLAWLGGDREDRLDQPYSGRLLAIILLGSIPVGILGFAVDSLAADTVRRVAVFGVTLILGGILLWAAERYASTRPSRGIKSATTRDGLIVGGAQALALIPGVSRSGATISAGLLGGFGRQDAARFSFLLSTPAIAGAGLYKALEAAAEGLPSSDIPAIVAGTLTAGIVGWLSIRLLLRFLQTRTYLPFVIYRLALGIFVLAVIVPT
jgi:undecaprenyl-diphosphatase